MEFEFRNVNEAFNKLVTWVHDGDIATTKASTRAGDVLQLIDPVLIHYRYPTERVLFNGGRDANPFFHLYEALWMLNGRNDVASLSYYNSNIAKVASDDGEIFNGAYGYRWRQVPGIDEWNGETPNNGQSIDQIQVLINHLKDKPNSRRAVLQMWNVYDDLLKIDTSKDVCCNTCIYFAIRSTVNQLVPKVLDMTVCNRSNDMIWGLLGSDYVCFTILQEYVAAMLGVEVGEYVHFTNNLHVYLDNWNPEEWLTWHQSNLYRDMEPVPLVSDTEIFDNELTKIVNSYGGSHLYTEVSKTSFLENTARPAFEAYYAHKSREYGEAERCLRIMEASDWQLACTNWINKRAKAYAERV